MGTIEKVEVPEYLCGENQWETAQNLQLFEAAEKGDVEKLRHALSIGANPNFFNGQKEGVLHAVAKNASTDAAICAKELISQGARVSAVAISNRNSVLHEAAACGAKEVCSVLIESQPKCTEIENTYGSTALHAATRSGNPDIVQLLLQASADPNNKNNRGSTPLHIACFLASPDSSSDDPYIKIAALLLSNEQLKLDVADVNGYTPLHIAAQRGADQMVRLLIDSGFSLEAKTNVDEKGRGGRTPEAMARFGGHEATAAMIKEFAEAINRGEDVATKKMAAMSIVQ